MNDNVKVTITIRAPQGDAWIAACRALRAAGGRGFLVGARPADPGAIRKALVNLVVEDRDAQARRLLVVRPLPCDRQ